MVSDSQESLNNQINLTLETCERLGLVVNMTKSYTEPARSVQSIGSHLDS